MVGQLLDDGDHKLPQMIRPRLLTAAPTGSRQSGYLAGRTGGEHGRNARKVGVDLHSTGTESLP
jgi:hypothetical protein